MLHEFLLGNRAALIARCRLTAHQRFAPTGNGEELAYGIPLFLDQIIKTLLLEQGAETLRSRQVSGTVVGASALSEIGATARQHAQELLQRGFSIDQVVHNYGDLCQAITDLASAQHVPILVEEFRTLNRCLDNAIADCVTEYADARDQLIADRGVEAFHERLGIFAHELRNLISTATHALTAIRTGQVGLAGPTGAVLDRALIGLRNLVDRSLTDVRLGVALPARKQLLSVADFIAEVRLSAALEASSHQCALVVAPIDARLAVDVDRDMLFSALGNLLQNAFKFTAPGSEVVLQVHASAERIRIDVEDRCGGLPAQDAEQMFRPFTQNGTNRSGLGLGLSICRRCVEANGGELSVRNMPGEGCVFTIDLPRHTLAERFFRS